MKKHKPTPRSRQAVLDPELELDDMESEPVRRPKKKLRKPPKRRKRNPRRRLFRYFLFLVALIAVVILGAVASQQDQSPVEAGVTSEQLREQLEYVKDLVALEYHYTDADKQELPGKTLFDVIPVPWTEKAFIVSYDGVIKYGVDIGQVGISVNDVTKIVTVTIPKAKIISHEIPEDGFRVLYEANGLFNKISIDDVTRFRMTQKEKMEDRAKDMELPQKAQEQSGEAILALLKAAPGMEEYSIELEYEH